MKKTINSKPKNNVFNCTDGIVKLTSEMIKFLGLHGIKAEAKIPKGQFRKICKNLDFPVKFLDMIDVRSLSQDEIKEKEILLKVQEIIIYYLEVDEALPEHKLEKDLGADSFDVIELTDEFDIKFDTDIVNEQFHDRMVLGVLTVNDIVKRIKVLQK